jgi:hypothetical protein
LPDPKNVPPGPRSGSEKVNLAPDTGSIVFIPNFNDGIAGRPALDVIDRAVPLHDDDLQARRPRRCDCAADKSWTTIVKAISKTAICLHVFIAIPSANCSGVYERQLFGGHRPPLQQTKST